MAGSMTDYLENKILEHSLGKTAYSMPTIYAALFSTALNETGNASEFMGNGYARVHATFASAANGRIANDQNVVFPAATGNWGSVVSVGLFDAPTGGNLLWYGSLDAAKTINTNDQFVLPTNSVAITLD